MFSFRSVEATAAMVADRYDGGREPGRDRKIGGSQDFRPFPDPDDEDDDCIVEDTPDAILFRDLAVGAGIRVELVMKEALQMYEKEGADIVEVF